MSKGDGTDCLHCAVFDLLVIRQRDGHVLTAEQVITSLAEVIGELAAAAPSEEYREVLIKIAELGARSRMGKAIAAHAALGAHQSGVGPSGKAN